MITQIDLETACDVIYRFADANQMDPLKGIETMVSYYNQLAPHEQQALTVFMTETGRNSKVD
jgi:hypothetical protein